MMDRAIGLAGLALAVISLVAGTLFPKIGKKVAWSGLAIGLILLVIAGGLVIFPDGKAQTTTNGGQPAVINQGAGSAYSVGQQGGITAGTLNFGPQKRSLSNPNAARLKSQMLEWPKDKPISVTAILGDTESIDFATEIYDFLKESGFDMKGKGISEGVFLRTPKGLIIENSPNGEIELIIGEQS